MIWRFFRQDVAWAGLILMVALSYGGYRHWQLVQAGWQGQLQAFRETELPEEGQVQGGRLRLIELPEARELFNQKETLFVDVSKPQDYDELHITGAVNLPQEELSDGQQGQKEITVLKGIPKDHKILVYCGSGGCDRSVTVAQLLLKLGYNQIKLFPGGFHAWDEAGYPMDTNR